MRSFSFAKASSSIWHEIMPSKKEKHVAADVLTSSPSKWSTAESDVETRTFLQSNEPDPVFYLNSTWLIYSFRIFSGT